MKISDLLAHHPSIYTSAMQYQLSQGLEINGDASIMSFNLVDTEEGFDIWMDVYNRKFDSWYKFHDKIKEGEIQIAKEVLRKHGFYVDNLWQIADVTGEGSDEAKMECLDMALTNEATMEQIHFAIREFKEECEIKEIKSISFSCKVYPSNTDIFIFSEGEKLGFMHYSLDGIKEAFEEDKEQFTQEVRAEICDYFAEEMQGANIDFESLDKVLDQINTRLSQ